MYFFGSIFGFVIVGDVGESDILLLCALLVTYFSLHMEADHQLVNYHADDGAKERGEKGHQEPAVSNPEEWYKKELIITIFTLSRGYKVKR